jgi:hypothetical protein
MKNRNLISLAVAFGFLSIGITGILMYFGQKGGITTVHVVFGLLFVAFSIFHVINNWNSIKLYTLNKQKRGIRKEFILVGTILLAILIGAAVNLRPFAALAHAGEEIGRGEEGERGERERGFFRNASFEEVITNEGLQGTSLSFIIQKSNNIVAPSIAIWVVDSTGRFAGNLFVPSKVAKLKTESGEERRERFEGRMETEDLKPELLTEWYAASGGSASNYDGITPVENFFLNTKTTSSGKFSVLMEVTYNGTKELYRADVDMTEGKLFKLESQENKMLTRAILEVVNL